DKAYGAEGIYLAYRIAQVAPDSRVIYAPDLVMRHDYYEGWRNFVWKARRYRRIQDEVRELVDDPGFTRYLDAYRARPKPQRRLTIELLAARRLLTMARWAILRLPAWAADRVGGGR